MQRRSFLLTSAAAGAAWARHAVSLRLLPPLHEARPRPSTSQLRYQHAERALFLHFGINTFTDREWGDGTESPSLFNPSALDAGQWARAARRAGFRSLILTAKHHDGFCLWPSAMTRHSVASSPWRSGEGDVVREFTDACRAEGLGAGLYLSPWDRHEPSYGDSPRYNDFYIAQLTELLTRYGTITEVWFDGANGEGPNGKHQLYDWERIHRTVRRLQPQAVMFSDAGPDVRWIGNEKGIAGDPNWATVNPATVPYPGVSGPAVEAMLQHGDPDGSVWRPGEADVSIRPGWFWHPAENDKVKSAGELTELYFMSVGRNANLLLNVPPTRDGLLHETDVRNLTAFGNGIAARFETDLAADARVTRSPHAMTLALSGPARFDVVDLREAIEHGQRVAGYRVEAWSDGRWTAISQGTTIGHRKLDRVALTTAEKVRLVITDAVRAPIVAKVGLYGS
jgi:alpha-L-fucosidase